MLEELHRLLSTSTSTGYQTILVSIITTILTSILLYNSKLIGKIIRKGSIRLSEFIMPIIKDTIVNFMRTVRLITNRANSRDIGYLRSKQKQNKIRDYEKNILDNDYKNRCLQGKISNNEWRKLQDKKDNNESLEDYEIQALDKSTKRLMEVTKDLRSQMSNIDTYVKDLRLK